MPNLWLPDVLLLLATALAYARLRGQAFVTLDDPEYVYANPHVTSGLSFANLRWAFTTGTNFPDYPKYGWWSDGLYISTREFNAAGTTFMGAGAYAIKRADLITGTVFVETMFRVPGLGRYFVQSVVQRDYPMIQATVLVITAMFILSNLAADLVQAPRYDPSTGWTNRDTPQPS